MQIFKDNLKPKFHLLTHYPTVLKNCGPLRKFWSFKYEAKHKQFKIYSHTTTSRKNICLTLAKKYQFKFCNQILHFSNTDNKCVYMGEIESNFSDIIRCKLSLNNNYPIKYFSKVEHNGYKYTKGFFVATCSDDYKIFLIINILKIDKNGLLFCQQLRNIIYNSHFTAFEINPNQLGEFAILKFEDIVGPPLTINKIANGQKMIRIKEHFIM